MLGVQGLGRNTRVVSRDLKNESEVPRHLKLELGKGV